MNIGMMILIIISLAVALGGMVISGNPELMVKLGLIKFFQGASRGQRTRTIEPTELSEEDLKKVKQSAEEFLEFDTIHNGMISFTNNPMYFSMGFGVNGVNINMFNPEEKLGLKNGFMSILNTLKDDTQILVQSRYIDLSQNFQYYKPVMDANSRDRERILDRAKLEKSEVVKAKLMDKAADLKQRDAYAKHIVEFFDFYVKQSDCIYINIFVFVNFRYEAKTGFRFDKDRMREESYNVISNKVKILKEQFESIGLKTYSLDSTETAKILYNLMLKNDAAYQRLDEALKNGLLDMVVQGKVEEPDKDEDDDLYEDDYDYDWREEVAVGMNTEYFDKSNVQQEVSRLKGEKESNPMAGLRANVNQNSDMHFDLDSDNDSDEE